MPTRPPRACTHPGCGGIAGRCTQHPTRAGPAERGYGPQWRALVAAAKQLQRDAHGTAWCLDCGITEATARQLNNPLTGDHLRWPARTTSDVEIVCRRCNSARPARRGRDHG